MEKINFNLVIAFFAVLLIALLAMRMLPFLRFFILFFLLFIVVGIAIYLLVQFINSQKESYEYNHSTEGRISERLAYCKEKIQETNIEIQIIRKDIKDLEKTALKAAEEHVSEEKKAEVDKLLTSFRSELELRNAKLSFFRSCIEKLDDLLYNEQLSSKLEQKKEHLEKLKEDHYEDLAGLEELKSDVEMEVLYLDTIEKLSLKMEESLSLDEAKELSLELEEMTKDLDEFGQDDLL